MKPPKYVTPPFDVPGKLTKGKKYEVRSIKEYKDFIFSFDIDSDSGNLFYCLLKNCAHLQGKDWIIIE